MKFKTIHEDVSTFSVRWACIAWGWQLDLRGDGTP